MPAFLLDEHLRGRIYEVLQRHNSHGRWPLDLAVVGGPREPGLGSADSQVLQWCEIEGRILVTADKEMVVHIRRHFELGQHLPGVIILTRPPVVDDVRAIFEYLCLVSGASSNEEWRDLVAYFP